MKRFSNKDYLQKLKEKDIKVIPLEEYKGSKVKILHKCICDSDWFITPNSVLSGSICGCQLRIYVKSNKWYLEKLEEKDIKVIPLEGYKGSDIKILHKCVCGNEWSIIPSAILKGNLCGCNLRQYNQTKSNSWYLEKLKEKGISIIPLEPYIESQTKILHKCYCNKEWYVKPMSILQGNGCGCRRSPVLRGEIFYKDKKTILYYIYFREFDLYKIGITLYKDTIKESIKKRFREEYTQIDIIQADIFIDGSEAFILEQQILFNNREFQYLGEKVLAAGNTELFINNIR